MILNYILCVSFQGVKFDPETETGHVLHIELADQTQEREKQVHYI